MKNLAIDIINDAETLGGRLDLYPDTKVQIEYVLSDIREPENRKISYTKEFTIPGTKNNCAIFMPFFKNGYSYTVFNPNKRLKAQVSNGAVLFDGSLQLTQVNDNDGNYEFTVIIYNKVVDFFNDLGDDELRGTISLNEYNHVLDLLAIKNSWTNLIKRNANNYQASNGEGYVYPLEDRGQVTMKNNKPYFPATSFRPAVFLKTYIDKVFQYYGWKYESNFFNSEYFKKLVVPFSSDSLVAADENSNYGAIGFVGITQAEFRAVNSGNALVDKISSFTQPDNMKNQGERVSTWKTLNWSTDVSDPGNAYSGGVWTVKKSGLYKVNAVSRFSAQIRKFGGSDDYTIRWDDKQPYIEMEIMNSAGVAVASNKTYFTFSGAQNLKGWQDSVINASVTKQIQATVGEIYTVRYRLVWTKGKFYNGFLTGWTSVRNFIWGGLGNGPETSAKSHFDVSKLGSTSENQDVFQAELVNKDVQYGDIIPMNNAIPDGIKMKDFFASINNLFNLYWEPTDREKTLRIEPYEDFFNYKGQGGIYGDDWTHKVDRKSDYTIYPLYELTANEYKFTYKEDSDWANERYTLNNQEIFGEKTITIDSDFVTDQKVISPIYSPTPLVELEYFNSNNASVTAQRLILPSYTKRDANNKKTSMNPKLRLLFWGGLINEWVDFEIGYQSGVDSAGKPIITSEAFTLKYPYAGHLDNPYMPKEDLNYGLTKDMAYTWTTITNNNLFNKYWRNWLNSIIDIDAHMLACKVKLSQLDMNAFNLKNYYHVDGVHYRVNKLTYDVDTEIADVELLRVFDYAQFQPSYGLYIQTGFSKVETANGTTIPGGFVPTPKPTTPVSPVFPTWPTPGGGYPIPPNIDWTLDEEAPRGGRPWAGTVAGTWVTPTINNKSTYTGTSWITPNQIQTTYAVRSEDRLPLYRKREPIIGNNLSPVSDLVMLNGFNNQIADELYGPVMVNGNDNLVNAKVSNVSILGSNNVIASGVENTQVIGSGLRVTESNVSYINGAIIKDGQVRTQVDLIRGGIDGPFPGPYASSAVQNQFNMARLITNLKGGNDSVRNYGSQTPEEYINGNIE